MTNNETIATRFKKLYQLTFMDFLVLQRLSTIKKPIIRYQLMQDIRIALGDEELSTAKFYRILEKLLQLKLVAYLPKNEEQKEFYLTQEGYTVLRDSIFLSAQISMTIFSLLTDQIPKIKVFVGGESEKTLLIDQIGLIGIHFINEIKRHTKVFSILTNDDQFKWLKANLKVLDNTVYKDGVIKEPDQWFDLIMILLPSAEQNKIDLQECYRVLKEEGRLVLLEIINPIKITNHFLIEALAENYFHPIIKFKSKAEINTYYDHVKSLLPWKKTTKYEWKGLYLLRLDK